MVKRYQLPIWKTAPLLRLLLPFIAGIILQWHLSFNFQFIGICLICFGLAFFLLNVLPLFFRYKLQWLQGIALQLIILCTGLLATHQINIRVDGRWFGHSLPAAQVGISDSTFLIVTINEPLIEKAKSYKAEGIIESIIIGDDRVPAKGKLLIYFAKDSLENDLQYGDKILIKKLPQKIKNSGNPGAFNYERYAAFQQLFHQAYLKKEDWQLLPEKNINPLMEFIFSARQKIVDILRQYIGGGKDEKGIAEALLIGYKQDLDKDLVQAYSNTGVVHIIAISGLHLGLIYAMLVWIFNLIPGIKKSSILKVFLILSCLWLFALLTGASASVLRSAVMFTCILLGKNFFRDTSIYSSLAASAFLLLAYNPYYLWDVGFQLSYLALIGIIWLQKPIYHLWYVKNKWLRMAWNMAAVTIAAQALTFPICIYYFHQFPVLFLLTNLIAVPLSTAILFAEIFLVTFSWIHFFAPYMGKITGALIWLMNYIIQAFNSLSFSVMDKIYATAFTTWVLYALVISICCRLIYKNKLFLKTALLSLFAFTALQVFAKFQLGKQQKIIVYNVPKYQAIDFIYHDKYNFLGDTILNKDALLQNFHLKPARISLQASEEKNNLPTLFHENNYWQFGGKKIMIIDARISFEPLDKKVNIDILLISKNPSVEIKNLITALNPAVIVFDGSNSLWKIAQWKKQCEQLALRCHFVSEEGAYILNIGD